MKFKAYLGHKEDGKRVAVVTDDQGFYSEDERYILRPIDSRSKEITPGQTVLLMPDPKLALAMGAYDPFVVDSIQDLSVVDISKIGKDYAEKTIEFRARKDKHITMYDNLEKMIKERRAREYKRLGKRPDYSQLVLELLDARK